MGDPLHVVKQMAGRTASLGFTVGVVIGGWTVEGPAFAPSVVLDVAIASGGSRWCWRWRGTGSALPGAR